MIYSGEVCSGKNPLRECLPPEMDIYKFDKLSLEEKAKFAWAEGTFLQLVEQGESRFNLYRTKYFFIEVEINSKTNSIVEIRAFRTGKTLEKYIDLIN